MLEGLQPMVNAFYDQQVVQAIHEKYGLSPLEALRAYLASETYRMFIDPALDMTEFAPSAIFELWESEEVTGDPRNSLCIREG